MSDGEFFLTEGLKECAWDLMERQTQTFGNGGASYPLSLGPAYWKASFDYEVMPADYRLLSAWIARRRRALSSFTAWRPAFEAPVATPQADNAGLTVTSNAGQVTFGGLSGRQLTVGDMVSYYGADLNLWCGIVTAISSQSSSTCTFEAEPYPPTPAGSPQPRLFQALAEFRLDPDSLSVDEGYNKIKRVSFTATQVQR